MCCYTAVSYTAVGTPVVGESEFVKYPHTHTGHNKRILVLHAMHPGSKMIQWFYRNHNLQGHYILENYI